MRMPAGVGPFVFIPERFFLAPFVFRLVLHRRLVRYFERNRAALFRQSAPSSVDYTTPIGD